LDKVQAFDVLASALNLAERPVSEARTELFRLVFNLGGYALGELDRRATGRPPLVVWGESWEMLGSLYEGLAELEVEAMRSTYALNLEQFLAQQSAEQLAEDEAATSSQA
jgi:hypothetical protein